MYKPDELGVFIIPCFSVRSATDNIPNQPMLWKLAKRLGCLFMFDRNLFLGLKNSKKKDSWGFLFFPVFSGGFFCRNVVLERVSGIPVLRRFHRNFLQEFLRDRNSCVYNGFLRIPPDSSAFLFLPNAVWLWPATKVGFLLSKYRLK